MSKRGRLAKTTSFLVKHSSAMEGDETTSSRRDPSWSNNTGPCLLEIFDSVL